MTVTAEREPVPAAGDSRVRLIAGLAVSAVSLATVAWWASRQERPQFPRSVADAAPLAFAVLVYVLVTATRAWRWHRILLLAGVRHQRTDAYALTAVCYMGNTVLPARGGEILRILLMAERSSGRKREILGSIVAERMLDAATLLVLLAGLSFSGLGGSSAGRELAAICAAGAVLLVLVVVAYKLVRRRGHLGRAAQAVAPLIRAAHVVVGRRGAALAVVTLAVWVLEGVVLWFVVRAVDVGLSLPEATFLVALTSVVIAVPAAPGYIGTFDAALVFGLAALGVGGGDAIAIALLWRFVLFVPVTAVGLLLVVTRYGGLPQLRSAFRSRAAAA